MRLCAEQEEPSLCFRPGASIAPLAHPPVSRRGVTNGLCRCPTASVASGRPLAHINHACTSSHTTLAILVT